METYKVKSFKDKVTEYIVTISKDKRKNERWSCTCPAFKYNSNTFCKHIEYVKLHYDSLNKSKLKKLNLINI